MPRILTRPMFRIGGSAEGITSGLTPRQGYKENGSVKQNVLDRSLADFYKGDPSIREVRDLADLVGYKPRGTNVYDFMTQMGLNLASTPSQGGIFQQVATAAKDPYEKFLTGKRSAAEQEYASKADMFKTFLEAGATAAGEGKTYAHRDKAAMVRENMDEQYKIYEQLDTLDPEAEDYEGQRENLLKELRTLKELISTDEFAAAQLKYWGDDRNSRKLDSWILRELEKTLGVPFDEENADHVNAFNKRREEIMNDIRLGISPTFKFATGGRVGYQAGNTVMPASTGGYDTSGLPGYDMEGGFRPSNLQGFTDQGPAPEDMGPITYEELRARLPQEISDDIVRLLANSAEALEDFAMIQTEQDINNFNRKYGVTLVLPAEG